jgi:hypothetical protein
MGATRGESNPPSDTINPTVWVEVRLGAHRLRFWVVGQLQPEVLIDLRLVVRCGCSQHLPEVPECGDQIADLILRHPGTLRRLAELGLRQGALRLGLGDPAAHHAGVGAAVQRRPVARQLRLTLPDRRARRDHPDLTRIVVLTSSPSSLARSRPHRPAPN